MEIQVPVDSTTLTLVLDDDITYAHERQIREAGAVWLREARRRLTKAINYSRKAMVKPTKVAALYWDLLYYYYFGTPRGQPDAAYQAEINTIIRKLQATSAGLNGDLTLADIGQMAGLNGFVYKCAHVFTPPSSTLGVVLHTPLENASRILTQALGKAAPIGVTQAKPIASPIHLNFDYLLQKPEWYGVSSVIHEGTHKFAETDDKVYFPGESAWDMFDEAFERCHVSRSVKAEMGNSSYTFDLVLADARKAVKSRLSHHHEAVEKLPREQAINNADGLARYAYDVSDFPNKEETEKAVKAILGAK